jgi:hypothetical protein
MTFVTKQYCFLILMALLPRLSVVYLPYNQLLQPHVLLHMGSKKCFLIYIFERGLLPRLMSYIVNLQHTFTTVLTTLPLMHFHYGLMQCAQSMIFSSSTDIVWVLSGLVF